MGDLVTIGRGSTAKTTAFVSARLDGDDGRWLWLDGNQKITAGNGTFAEPKPNAFSILDRHDCPFRTPACELACYVSNLAEAVPDLHSLYAHNSRTIREIILDPLVSWAHWADRLASWIEEHAAGGFRWHVSGDIFSEEYAEFIERVCVNSPDVRHWIYTRSFPFLGPLVDVSTVHGGNLAVNLSADRDNYWLARRYADDLGFRVCYMTTDGSLPPDLRDDDVVFPDYALRGPKGATPSAIRAGSGWWASLDGRVQRLVCPVDMYGKAENIRCAFEGGCSRCLS